MDLCGIQDLKDLTSPLEDQDLHSHLQAPLALLSMGIHCNPLTLRNNPASSRGTGIYILAMGRPKVLNSLNSQQDRSSRGIHL